MTKKPLIITGSSRGIGAATAILAARKGYPVCVNYHNNSDAAEAVLADIKNAGGKAIAVQADMTSESDIIRLFATTENELGPIGGLVNNAGMVDLEMRLDEMTADRFTKMFATNIFGPFVCAREAVKRLSTKHGGDGGVIVNVSSIAARLGSANSYVDYAASKAAIDTMTVGLANEVAAEGVRVVGVRPGIILTDIHGDSGNANRPHEIAPTIPMKRAGEPMEIANTILWLLSDEASYATGTTIDISGGR